MKQFNKGDKVVILRFKPKWYEFRLKAHIKIGGRVVGYINNFLEHYLAYEVYTNKGIWLVPQENMELIHAKS